MAAEIRDSAYKKYIKPTREKGSRTVTVRAGDVHEAMGLKSRMPTVCGALGTNKFLKQNNLRLFDREGPTCVANVYFTYEILQQLQLT